MTIVLGVALYFSSSIHVSTIGLAAIFLNMVFAVFERLTQRYLMAQAPVDINKAGMMLLNNAANVTFCNSPPLETPPRAL